MKRTLKRTDARPRNEGWQPKAPGIYGATAPDEDAAGALHLSIPELLEIFRVKDTPENRQTLTAAAQALAAVQWPGVSVAVRE